MNAGTFLLIGSLQLCLAAHSYELNRKVWTGIWTTMGVLNLDMAIVKFLA